MSVASAVAGTNHLLLPYSLGVPQVEDPCGRGIVSLCASRENDGCIN